MTPWNWSDQEKSLIREHYPATGTAILASLLPHRDQRTLQAMARALGCFHALKKRNHSALVWTPDMDLVMRQIYPLIRKRTSGVTPDTLAKRLGVTPSQVRYRAICLGLTQQKKKDPPWTEDEIEFLASRAHLSVSQLGALMRKKGWNRTQTAITNKRCRLGYQVVGTGNAYSANELARLLGKKAPTVAQWINRGWLRATPRTESIDPLHGGVGDRWLIKPQAVRDFVFTHSAYIDLGLVDKDWFLALIEGTKPTRKVLLQETCGKGSNNETYSVAGDYAECA
ncbi:MAG: helix-turn-helix domain-containing protein [Candidatus Competibacter denitrificans]